MEKSIKSISVNYGLYLGFGLTLYTIACYIIDLNLFTNIWLGVGIMLFIILMSLFSSTESKKALGGFITFKNAFTSYFIALVIGLTISTIISLIIFNVIDTEAAKELQEISLEKQISVAKNWGAPNEALSKMAEDAEKNGGQFSIGNTILSLALQIVGYSVVGLIVAAIVKKNQKNEI